MVLDVVTIFSQLIRAALIPHTLDRQSPHRAQFGIWQAFSGIFSDHGNYFRYVYSYMYKVILVTSIENNCIKKIRICRRNWIVVRTLSSNGSNLLC